MRFSIKTIPFASILLFILWASTGFAQAQQSPLEKKIMSKLDFYDAGIAIGSIRSLCFLYRFNKIEKSLFDGMLDSEIKNVQKNEIAWLIVSFKTNNMTTLPEYCKSRINAYRKK